VIKISLLNGQLLDPVAETLTPSDLFIADGRIVAKGAAPEGFVPDQVLEVQGKVISPGFIDLSAHLCEPGFEHKATIASETRAAVKGGVTTLCCSPETEPPCDTPAVIELIREKAEFSNLARVIPIGALTQGLRGEMLSEMYALKSSGCRLVGNGSRPLVNPLVWRRALEYAATYDLLVMVRPMDPWLRGDGTVHEGPLATRLGLPGIPASAETVAVAQILALMEETGAKVHFSCLSTARAAAMIVAARQNGLPVSSDVAAHSLHLTEEAVDGFDPIAYVLPPLRTDADRDGLRRAVADGGVDAICSDHQPHEADAKADVFAATKPGISALETVLSLTLQLVEEGELSLPRAIARLTSGPAGILEIASGSLAVGEAADLCVFDSQAEWQVGEGGWLSRGRNTPFWGETMRGQVALTLVGGRVVYSHCQSAISTNGLDRN